MRARIRQCLLLLVFAPAQLCVTVFAEPLPEPGAPVTIDPLILATAWLRDQSPAERARFAMIALDEFAASYESELVAAARDKRQPRDPASLSRWRAGVREAINNARALAATLMPRDSVLIYVDPGPTLRFVVHGRTVMVDAPRVGRAKALGPRVLERYCRTTECPDLVAPRRARSGTVRSSWSFAARQPAFLETAVGLGFRFEQLTDLRERKRACEALVAALVDTADHLVWLRDRGALIEWEFLHLTRRPRGDGSVLVVNHHGDYLEVGPERYEVPREPLMNWFRARLGGRRYEHVFDAAERLFLAQAR